MDLDAHVKEMSALLFAELGSIADEYPERFEKPRGIGLLVGLPVKPPHETKPIVAAALHEHLLVNGAGHNTLRFAPPLIIGENELREGMRRLRRAIAAA